MAAVPCKLSARRARDEVPRAMAAIRMLTGFVLVVCMGIALVWPKHRCAPVDIEWIISSSGSATPGSNFGQLFWRMFVRDKEAREISQEQSEETEKKSLFQS